MSKRARTLTLAALLAAMNLAGMTAVAHADPATDDRPITTPQHPTNDDIVRLRLARERSSIPNMAPLAPAQVTSPTGPAEPSGQPDWLTPALSALSAALALVAGVAVMAARRANRTRHARQTA
jgi:hypothetical protein